MSLPRSQINFALDTDTQFIGCGEFGATTEHEFLQDVVESKQPLYANPLKERTDQSWIRQTEVIFDDKMSTGTLNQARVAKSSVLAKNVVRVVNRWQLTISTRHIKMAQPVRRVVLGEVSNSAARTGVLRGEMTSLRSEYSTGKANVDQRLQRAVGANPGLQEVANQLSGQHQVQVGVVHV